MCSASGVIGHSSCVKHRFGEKRVPPDRPVNSSAERSSTVVGHHLPEMDDGSKFTWEGEGSSQSEKVEQCRTASAIFALIGVIVNE